MTRRAFAEQLLKSSALLLSAPACLRHLEAAPSIARASAPLITHGVASGDVTDTTAVIWSRTDRPARMIVEWSTRESFSNRRRIAGPVTGPEADFTAKILLQRLPRGQRILYRVFFEDRGSGRGHAEPHIGELVTATRGRGDVHFAWSGDTCGQGYGIDSSRGGMLTYLAMRNLRPDFFVHSGDTIYADNPLETELKLADGSGVWRNLVTEEKSKVAETLAEFRGNHRYNLLDTHVRAFNAAVPIVAQWDDHEVRNNWFPGQLIDDPRYHIRDVNTLARHARQAFCDYFPIRPDRKGRIYRNIQRGTACELFILDLRSYRGANSANRQSQISPDTAYMGREQLDWLTTALKHSRATWKIICSDMPIGMVVADGKAFENCSNGNGPPLGRELEIAALLRFLKQHRIRNVLWLTADVHHAVSHHYDPARAQFTDFDPFWEFVSGPLHAGTFGPSQLDDTFGPAVRWNSRAKGAPTTGPHSKEQFFGTVRIDGLTQVATVTHWNRDGEKLWSIELPPDRLSKSR
ncbi:MAG: alkaline phosphatase D family protein [Verrucomicrobiota bacterium]